MTARCKCCAFFFDQTDCRRRTRNYLAILKAIFGRQTIAHAIYATSASWKMVFQVAEAPTDLKLRMVLGYCSSMDEWISASKRYRRNVHVFFGDHRTLLSESLERASGKRLKQVEVGYTKDKMVCKDAQFLHLRCINMRVVSLSSSTIPAITIWVNRRETNSNWPAGR